MDRLAGAYPSFNSIKWLGVFLLRPGWDATVQPKNNARARTSFCFRKKKFFLRLIAGHLSLSPGNRKNFFAVA